jgi:hypothetical protein
VSGTEDRSYQGFPVPKGEAPNEEARHRQRVSATDYPGHGQVMSRVLELVNDTLKDGCNLRLLNVIEEDNREILRLKCDSSMSSSNLLSLMDKLIDFYGKPAGIRTNNGPELKSGNTVSWAERQRIEPR